MAICFETCPAISIMVWSPAPLSASSVMSVCRLSCQRPVTLALSRTLLQAVFSVVTGRVGSLGRGFPNLEDVPLRSNLPKSVRVPCNVLRQRREQSRVQRDGAASPPSVLLRPTARNFFAKLICAQVNVLISASRIPAFSASVNAK